ncbi:UDP-glucose dehydrogenase family protein [Sutcliffiella horikoshii]|uniref:UDP-glucose dehydrogenase family protein n=1 Tax=Sutcliffiella horikoshii TaxID=79883 RepID=UPI001F35B364|nr:UDP-glucose/GDP-mannose dehydrogenase family protein [Sutcliffiella horikoshii]MCG1020142.1 UDP-glucose/GDP-mannose dehydrogenase family protein [Sutcliffiella horikoshii]
MNILVIGTGYVGTTTALVFAEMGHKVTGLDIDEKKIRDLQNAKMPFYEPGLLELLLKNLKSGSINFTTNTEEAIKNNEIIFICVGTPSAKNGQADLKYVREVAYSIGKYINGYKVIVDKSTVPVGTAEMVEGWIIDKSKGEQTFDVVSNPEFLKEGSALYDALHPDRIVIGANSNKAYKIMNELYSGVDCPIVETSPRTAEMIKYAANSFLALKISYINEIARLCEELDINVIDVSKGIGLDKRIGPSFLQAGIGYGGSCFPKDVKALLESGKVHSIDLSLLDNAITINETQPIYFLQKIKREIGTFNGKTVAILGLSFKPNTDDVRESPSIRIIQELLKEGAIIKVHDPVVILPEEKTVKQKNHIEETIENAEVIILCTDWDHYKNFDWEDISTRSKVRCFCDGRNCLESHLFSSQGIQYIGVGTKRKGG